MKDSIEIKGARVHNLKNIDVEIPHGSFTVITGVSGSGKTSLAFDTIFAEGQRRFIESMSSYARQFLGKLEKPEMDYIKGIAPSIAIQQKVISSNPRSTVGTTTEIYDYLKLLYARIGITYDPKTGEKVIKHSSMDVLNHLKSLPENSKIALLSPVKLHNKEQSQLFVKEGFKRFYLNNKFINIDDFKFSSKDELFLVIDRIKTDFSEEENESRILDSIELAFNEGHGKCHVLDPSDHSQVVFNKKFVNRGVEFQEPSLHFFAFNNPFGACKTCEGFGKVLGIDENLVIPNRDLSVYEGAIAPWKGEVMGENLRKLTLHASKFNFPIHRAIKDLSEAEYQLLWDGNEYFKGLHDFFKKVERKTYKIQYRVMLSRYRGRTDCYECKGTRLRGDASYVKINGKSIQDLVLLPVSETLAFFEDLKDHIEENAVSKRILPEIINRLTYLCDVGLGYLTLNRQANTLSGGESQRIHLATSLGSALVGSIYILDEPSIGLHPKDTENLIKVLKQLQKAGNTLIIVEHEEEIMRAADRIIDIGPKAGTFGGEIIFNGTHKNLMKSKNSLTGDYLNKIRVIPVPTQRRVLKNKITIEGAKQYNLKNFNLDIPLNGLVCVTGVSGSGKSSLIGDILYPALRKKMGISNDVQGKYSDLKGDIGKLKQVEFIDQNPIGKSSRSNPITYVKAFDDIRDLYSRQKLSKLRGYKPGFFSFNVQGGRCEMCEGEGTITVEMQFMADIHLQCENCKGKRYKKETLEIDYRDKNIHELLEMSLTEALDFFKESTDRIEKKIVTKIQPLVDVGLGYLKVGQSSSTMSGGEAQRIKLASFLAKGKNAQPTLFIFDEPTTGLHFYDIEKLILAFNALIDLGHSIIVIEHNVEVIKCADHIIDLGPEGGQNGGHILFEGTPEELTKIKKNETSRFLKKLLVE
ncbi:MAG: excinuclease ABC subunit UvrA [Bacteroidota bacterium]|nr:excinuclease ABC subunit UvrA [Bacteroidota bacterium]